MINHFEKSQKTVAVVGMGYVGLPLAIEFSKKGPVIGFDIQEAKIEKYKRGEDPTGEAGAEKVKNSGIDFTSDPQRLRDASVFIVTVPTPVHEDNTLNLAPLKSASRLVGTHMGQGSLVVYESTVYPGATEGVCIPILEECSGMRAGRDFRVGYSPERINPGDTQHSLTSVTKIVSGQDPETLEAVAAVYGRIFDGRASGGIYKVKSIKVAEATKVIENAQRDVNVAFMNEIAQILHRLDIHTEDVLEAMNTKWNALGFHPGLVGGHCIGVDPYYLIQEAEKTNYHANLLTTSRAINEEIPVMIARETVRAIVLAGADPAKQSVYVVGLTFKGNVNDMRNSKVKRIVDTLEAYGLRVQIADPSAEEGEIEKQFGKKPVDMARIRGADCLIVAAGHQVFAQWTQADFQRMMKEDGTRLLVDVCNLFDREKMEGLGYRYWSL